MNIKQDTRGTKWLSAGGKRISVDVIGGPWIEGISPDLIKIRSKRHSFPAEIKAVLKTENYSDMMEDYFENDTIRLMPDHPLYADAKAVA